MDYLPPERPAVVAQASDRSLANSERLTFSSAFGNLGMIDTLPATGEWEDTTTWKQRILLHELKPGQRVVFAKPQSVPEPVFYVHQLNPCSVPTFDAFQKAIGSGHSTRLDAHELQPLREIFGARITDKNFHTHAGQLDIDKHRVLMVNCSNIANKTYGESFLVVADRKKRLIQEIGYEGASEGQGKWSKQAHDMLMNVELKPEK